MQIRSVVVVAALGLTSFANAQQAVQWRVQDGGNGHWYARFDELCTWPEAKARCEACGGYLGSVPPALPETS